MLTVQKNKTDAFYTDIQSKQTYKYCQNANEATCNLLIPSKVNATYCVACELNRTIPPLATTQNRERWNKIEIAKAIEIIYARDGVKVLAVNTISVKGKKRRAQTKGAKSGYTPDWKKAVVTTDKPLSVYEELGV